MKTNKRTSLHLIVLPFFVTLFILGGLLYQAYPGVYAYSNAPFGYADYCALENNQTVIYGWASDSDAPVGAYPYVKVFLDSQSVVVPTAQSGYRDPDINAYLSQRGQPTSSVYGFRAVFSGINKGSNPTINGTLINYGGGTDSIMPINKTGGVGGSNLPYFANAKVPDACLATPTPPSQGGGTTTPNTGGSTGGSSGGSSTSNGTGTTKTGTGTTKTGTKTPATTPTVTSSADANASVSTGTKMVTVTVPGGNAESIHLAYGKAADQLTSNTDEVTVSGDQATFTISNLEPSSTYYFTIIRHRNGQTDVNSPNASFTTNGINMKLKFKNGDEPAGRLAINIKELNSSSSADENGVLSLDNLPTGTYTLVFSNDGKNYTYPVTLDASSSELVPSDGNPAVLSLNREVQIADLVADGASTTATTAPKKKSGTSGVLIGLGILLLLLLLGAGGFFLFAFLRRRRDNNDDFSYDVANLPPPPTTYPNTPTTYDANPQAGPNPLHTGESLKDLVIESMREKAAGQAEPAALDAEPAPFDQTHEPK